MAHRVRRLRNSGQVKGAAFAPVCRFSAVCVDPRRKVRLGVG